MIGGRPRFGSPKWVILATFYRQVNGQSRIIDLIMLSEVCAAYKIAAQAPILSVI